MQQTSLPSKVKISSDILFQQLGDEYVLLNMESEKYFGLDEVAARFWQLLEADSSTQKALETVQAEYEADPETIKEDLRIFLQRLADEKLITIEE